MFNNLNYEKNFLLTNKPIGFKDHSKYNCEAISALKWIQNRSRHWFIIKSHLQVTLLFPKEEHKNMFTFKKDSIGNVQSQIYAALSWPCVNCLAVSGKFYTS